MSNHSIGDDIAEKSKGLFSAADWACPKYAMSCPIQVLEPHSQTLCHRCGNVNWSRRTTCNVCNHNRAQVEGQRTGRGGGFSERDGVEYVKRDESDDEYDEFGRKKKKKQKFGQGGDLLVCSASCWLQPFFECTAATHPPSLMGDRLSVLSALLQLKSRKRPKRGRWKRRRYELTALSLTRSPVLLTEPCHGPLPTPPPLPKSPQDDDDGDLSKYQLDDEVRCRRAILN